MMYTSERSYIYVYYNNNNKRVPFDRESRFFPMAVSCAVHSFLDTHPIAVLKEGPTPRLKTIFNSNLYNYNFFSFVTGQPVLFY